MSHSTWHGLSTATDAAIRAIGHIRALKDGSTVAAADALSAIDDAMAALTAARDLLVAAAPALNPQPATAWPAASVTTYDDGSVLIAAPYVPVEPAPQLDPALRGREVWPAAGSPDAARRRNRGAQP